MSKSDLAVLEKSISDFLAEHAPSFYSLIDALDEAHISHYSSGCNNKRVTFDIFPASTYVKQLLLMLSIDRMHKPKSVNGLRDATANGEYNPGRDFIQYMRRWSVFAEQAMRREGDTQRGIAAARAKLIMEDMIRSLSEDQIRSAKSANAFLLLMRNIGLALEARARKEEDSRKTRSREATENNYLKALAAARG